MGLTVTVTSEAAALCGNFGLILLKKNPKRRFPKGIQIFFCTGSVPAETRVERSRQRTL
jgi:hypothetical protein